MPERKQFHIIIAPPGAGKTTYKEKYRVDCIDPEESINWKELSKRHGLYKDGARLLYQESILEHELNWGTVWNTYVLPRIYTAFLLEKDIIMGMITPSNAEIVTRFLIGFKETTTLFLPNEEQHFNQIWNNENKRPRTWGPQLRGWQNTYWIRLLLQGIATTIPLPCVQELPPRNEHVSLARVTNTATCEVLTSRGQRFIQTLSGKWAELNAQEEIIAMYTETTDEAGNKSIICDRTSKMCGKENHSCEEMHILTNDCRGNNIGTWIASNKITLPKTSQKKVAVLFFVGTLAPFHYGHLDILETAKTKLEEDGWHVLGGYVSTFTTLNENRLGNLFSILSDVHKRTTMVQLGTLHSDFIMPDRPLEHVLHTDLLENKNHPAQLLVERLRIQKIIPHDMEVTTFWVNGKDAHLDVDFFNNFAQHVHDAPLNPLRMAIIDNREENDRWSKEVIATTVPELEPFITRYSSHTKDSGTSATRVRYALENSNRIELRKAVGIPLVESYLLGLMHDSEA